MTKQNPGGHSNGIGILSAVILLGMAAVLVAVSTPVVDQVTTAARGLETRENLETLKTAIAGNAGLVNEGGRADFGFVGSMGDIPSALANLWIRSSQPAYAFDTTNLVGAGWIGPYVPDPFVENLLALDSDPFGNGFVYTSTEFNRNDPGEDGLRVG